MSMVGTGMATAVKAELEAITDWPVEGMNVIVGDMRFLNAVCTGIVNYIKANAVVLPDTLNNPVGQPVLVSIPSGLGATTAPQVIAGTGKVD